jgi:hypothetical protein
VQRGGRIVTVQLDVSDKAQVASLWSKVPQELRDVDILGVCIYGPNDLLGGKKNPRLAIENQN